MAERFERKPAEGGVRIRLEAGAIVSSLQGMLHWPAVAGGFVLRMLKWPILIALPISAFLLSSLWSLHHSLQNEIVEVPSLVGMAPYQAREALRQASLRMDITDKTISSSTVPEGNILQQDYAPGMRIKKGRTIDVVLSAGVRKVLVPRLLGKSLAEAKLLAREKGFSIRVGHTVFSSDVPMDNIIAQHPQPATSYLMENIDTSGLSNSAGSQGQKQGAGAGVRRPPRPIEVLVSRGPRPAKIIMPALEGRPLLGVLRSLRQQKVPVVVRERGGTDDVSSRKDYELISYIIYRQIPEAGSVIELPFPSPVILRVERGY